MKDEDGFWNRKEIKISSAHYHNRSGFQQRYNNLMRWTTREQTATSSKSVMSDEYTRYQLNIFAQKQQEFSQRKVVRLKLQKYLCVMRTTAKFAKDLIGGHKHALIAFGACETAPNSPMKGMIV